jgi:threonine dehydrogenase-like Zn-dependent dehydrogenase
VVWFLLFEHSSRDITNCVTVTVHTPSDLHRCYEANAEAMGADHMIDFTAGDVVEQIMELTDGRGVDVAIEALGTQGTFENALRVLRPGDTFSSLGVYSTDLRIPLNAFAAVSATTRS